MHTDAHRCTQMHTDAHRHAQHTRVRSQRAVGLGRRARIVAHVGVGVALHSCALRRSIQAGQPGGLPEHAERGTGAARVCARL
eukprot:4343601-Alexandrium_andersonii.AAC.1